MKVICKRRSGIVNYALISRELEIRVEALAMSLSCALGRGTFSAPLQVYMGATKLLGKPSFYGHLLRYTPFIAFMDNLLEMT